LRVFQEKKKTYERYGLTRVKEQHMLYPIGKHDEKKKIKIDDKYNHIYNGKISRETQ